MISTKNLRGVTLTMALLSTMFAEAQAQRRPYPRLGLEFGVNYALFSPDELNNFLARLDREKVENGFGVRGGLRVQVSKHFDFNTKIGFVTGVSKAHFIVTGEQGTEPIAIVQDEYGVRTIPVSIGIGGRVPLKTLSLRAEFNIEHHIARVQYKIPAIAGFRFNEFQTKAKSSGLGFSFTFGPEWRPFVLLAFNAKAGYRAAKISDFISELSGPLNTSLPIEFRLDLSGVFFEAGVQIRP